MRIEVDGGWSGGAFTCTCIEMRGNILTGTNETLTASLLSGRLLSIYLSIYLSPQVCSVVVHIRWLALVNKPLVFRFRASVCTFRLYIIGCHNFVILIVLLSSPGIISFFSTLRVFLLRLALSRFRQFSDVDTVFNQSPLHADSVATFRWRLANSHYHYSDF